MKLGLHWSWRRCHFWLVGLWSLSPPPSCGSRTCKVWSCSGKTCVPAGWSAYAWTNPTAAAGSGCPKHRMSNFWKRKPKIAWTCLSWYGTDLQVLFKRFLSNMSTKVFLRVNGCSSYEKNFPVYVEKPHIWFKKRPKIYTTEQHF